MFTLKIQPDQTIDVQLSKDTQLYFQAIQTDIEGQVEEANENIASARDAYETCTYEANKALHLIVEHCSHAEEEWEAQCSQALKIFDDDEQLKLFLAKQCLPNLFHRKAELLEKCVQLIEGVPTIICEPDQIDDLELEDLDADYIMDWNLTWKEELKPTTEPKPEPKQEMDYRKAYYDLLEKLQFMSTEITKQTLNKED